MQIGGSQLLQQATNSNGAIGIALMKKSMDTDSNTATQLINEIKQSNPAPADPNLGTRFDARG